MKKILIVEDTELNLDLFIQLLEDEYEIISAGEENQELRLLQQNSRISSCWICRCR
jgi:response regulator RpfG family c-di-GMP phosphodiesterase